MVSERRILTIIKVNAVYPLLLFCNDNMKKKKKHLSEWVTGLK